jgi:hypothetical protein
MAMHLHADAGLIPGWSFYFLEEKLVPDELGNAAVD